MSGVNLKCISLTRQGLHGGIWDVETGVTGRWAVILWVRETACCRGPEALPPTLNKPLTSAGSGLSNGSLQRRLLYLLLLPSSPRAEESPLVCLQTASSEQMQGLFANCHCPGFLQRPACWAQPCASKSHLPQADSRAQPSSDFPKRSVLACSWEN